MTVSKDSGSKRPLKIGVTFDFSESHGFFLKRDVVDSIHSQGAEVAPLLYDLRDVDKKLANLDGLVIPGGLGDLNPELYGQKKKYENVKIVQERCDFEYKLLEKYLPLNRPLLCICWGVQILNAYLGGSLHQDLPQDRPGTLKHEQTESKDLPTHWVHFEEKSEAISLFGAEKLHVNSTHHQGIDRLGKSLEAHGWSEDQLIECVKYKGIDFGWGVQWHPERLKGDPVIPAFLKACQHSRR